MTDISFYHLTTRSLEHALPKLLELTIESGERALVVVGNKERMEFLNEHLWSYEASSWLPHGARDDGDPSDHPIYLSIENENPNSATFLFLVDGASGLELDSFKRVFDLFDGRDEKAVAAARVRWASLKSGRHVLSYWRQGEDGRWNKA